LQVALEWPYREMGCPGSWKCERVIALLVDELCHETC
jgi:hypothetical protein